MKPLKVSIKTRLSAICVAILLLSVSVVSVVLFVMYDNNYEQQVYQAKQETVDQLAHNIESYFDDLNRLILTTLSNTYLMERLTAPPPANQLEALEKRRTIEDFLDDVMVIPREDILNVFILSDEIYYGGRYPASVDTGVNYEELDWYRAALDTGERIFIPARMEELITSPKHRVFSFARAFQNPYSLQRIGVIKVDANTKGIEQLCAKVDTGRTGGLIVKDESGQVLLSTFAPGVDVTAFAEAAPPTGGNMLQVGDEEYIFNTTRINSFGWTLVSFNSTEEFEALQNRQLALTVAIALASCGLAVAVLLLFASGFLKPLFGIVDLMKAAEDGDLTVRYREKRSDEIGYLGTSFNTMITRINQTTRVNTQLITEIYEARALQNKARLNALQAQIKPHFMCNTLNMISMLVQSGQQDEAVANINRLSVLMRGLANFDSSVPLKTELTLLRAYLDIQKTRYEDRLTYEETVLPALYGYLFPALLLQPIVENSIIHGCENKAGATAISISSRIEDDALYLAVEDDAGGMEEATLQAVRQKLADAETTKLRDMEQRDPGHGLGLANIHQRIRLFYGEQYGLRVDSAAGAGTTVTLHLPLHPQKQPANGKEAP